MSLIKSKPKIFLICCICFIAGITIASFFFIELIGGSLWWFLGAIVCAVIFVLEINKKKVFKFVFINPRIKFFIKMIALLGFFLFLGIWRYTISIPKDVPWEIQHYNNQIVAIQGKICGEPDIRQKNQKLEICTESVSRKFEKEEDSDFFSVSGKVLITTNLYPLYNYGDRLETICELKVPEEFNSFAYDKYLARYNIHSVCYYPKIKFINNYDDARGMAVLQKGILKFKNKLQDLINYGIKEPEAGLASAIILGNKNKIPSNLRETFSQAGISHIAAISGMHIGILSALTMWTLMVLGISRKKSFYFASLFLLFYIVLVGMPASAMRAGFMGFLALLAMNLGRLSRLPNILSFAAVILLLINPKLLRDDIGFQLSFLAVLGIIYFYPILDNFLNKILEIKFLSGRNLRKILKIFFGILFISVAAQIFTMPILAVNFSQFSIIAPISNLFVLWTLPFLMMAILLGLLLGFLLPSFAYLFFLPAYFLLKYIIFISEYAIKIPYAYIEFDYLQSWWIVIYYVVIFLIIKKNKNKKPL